MGKLKSNARPPKWIIGFFHWFCNPEIAEILEGDLLEQFNIQVATRGIRKAQFYYVLNVIRFFHPSFIKRKVTSNSHPQLIKIDMINNYIKSSFRSLNKNKFYSLINISGLAIGLAAFTLIALFVRHELSFDKYNKDADSIYRVVRNEYTCSPPPMAPMLKAEIPEIQFASRFILSNNVLTTIDDRYFTEDEYYWTDNEFLNIFTFDFIHGDVETVLNNPNDIIISESIAKKYFGNSDPMGEIITVSREHDYKVVGVFKDMPANSHFHFDIVLPIDKYFEVTDNDPQNWGSNYVYSYVKLHQQADMAAVNNKLVDIEKQLVGWTPDSGKPYEQYFFFQPITEIHLFSHRQQEVQVNGDIRNVYVFSSIALLILIIAGINYVNLTTAMSGKRYKEVGVRKAMGAKKAQLINQFLSESVIVALISTLVATIIVVYSQNYFAGLMGRNISIEIGDLPLLIPSLLLLAIVVGLVAGLLPSRSVSGVSVVSIIKGSSGNNGRKNGMRNVLVVVQFSIALILIILSINVQRQLSFIVEKDPGYEKDQIITMRLFDSSIGENLQSIKQVLLANRKIMDVSTSSDLPHRITGFRRPEWFCNDPSECTSISYNPVDYGFVALYDLEIVEGRNFSRDYPSDALGSFIVNEKAVKIAGWDAPIGMEISHYDGTKGKIVGVVKDFHFQSMHSDIAPLYLMLDEHVYSYFSIKIESDDIPETLASIEGVFNNFSPNTPTQFTFFDDEFEQAYNSEKRLGTIFTFFSVLAIILGCLGLYGMSTFIISQATKEIGIRKVLGASNSGISMILGKNFLKSVIFANLIAWPAAYYALNIWLESFAFRTNITVWSFLLASTIVLVITIITIGLQSRKISRQTPSVSLRYE